MTTLTDSGHESEITTTAITTTTRDDNYNNKIIPSAKSAPALKTSRGSTPCPSPHIAESLTLPGDLDLKPILLKKCNNFILVWPLNLPPSLIQPGPV